MKRAIILIDHGSTVAEANAVLEDVAALLRRLATVPVFTAHMELAEPSALSAFAAAVASGADEVVVHPYFLAPGRHSTADIPRLVAAAAAPFPHVRWRVTPPLGPDRRLAELVMQRVGADEPIAVGGGNGR